MNTRRILLGAAAGFSAGYALYRACEAFGARPDRNLRRDARRYGEIRRGLALAGIVRSLSEAAVLAYGPLGVALERSVQRAPVWAQPMAFAAGGAFLETIAGAGADYVEDYALEKRFELSEQPVASWLADKLKGEAVGAGVAIALAGTFAAVVRRFPRTWPWIASAATLPLLVGANIVVPIYIMPLFNKYTPLEGPLEERLRALASRYGVGDADILRVNMSKQTKKANAFVTGIGRTHRIVLGDTLIEHFPQDEIEFIVAHELGHYVSGDTWRMIAAGQIASTAVLFGSFALLEDHSKERAQRAVTLAQIAWWSSLISQAFRPALSAFSRSREWAADHFALQTTGVAAVGAAAFRRLRDQNLAEDEQPAWFEFLFASHPSLKARITHLERSRSY
ncbi:MAG: M48 family metalloprotease [Candidatus Baltobacteraceae bacterium]